MPSWRKLLCHHSEMISTMSCPSLVRFQQALHDAGLAVVSWPEPYGGRGLGPEAAAVVAARLGEGRGPRNGKLFVGSKSWHPPC